MSKSPRAKKTTPLAVKSSPELITDVEVVEVAQDQDNEPVTAAVVVPADEIKKQEPKESASQRRRRESKERRQAKSKKKRRQLVDFLNSIFILVFVIGLGAIYAMRELQNRYIAAGPLQQERIVIIPRDSGMDGIAATLRKAGVIENTVVFQIAAYANQSGSALKAGEYQFKPAVSMKEVVSILTEGRVVQHSITLPEGLTSEQIVAKLKEFDMLVGEVKSLPAEGALLPNTYYVTRGTTREQVVERLAAAQKKIVDEVWARRASDLPYKTPKDLVTMASVVEKETGVASERPMVAAVFINRLKRGMRLQSDPTIIYGIVGGKGTLGRPITRADITLKTAYNTYTIDGLPPTPIANPGRSALEAAANPASSRALFFVADGSGGHAFAETLDEHNANVAKWRAIEKAAGSEPEEGAQQ